MLTGIKKHRKKSFAESGKTKENSLKKLFSLARRRTYDFIERIKWIYIGKLNKILFILVCFSLFYMLYGVFGTKSDIPAPDPSAGYEKEELLNDKNLNYEKLDSYLKQIRGKSIFVSAPVKMSSGKIIKEKPLSEKISVYRIVGILWDNDISSYKAYLEDSRSNNTFSVSEGSFFDGMEVEKITEKSVIFYLSGENAELFI
jgi:hypothetical protein